MNNNFFELFGLPVGFEINQALLKERYLALQKQHHPDNADDKAKAEQNTALINHAFNTLTHYDSRAVYLLELANVDFNSDQSINDENFLMQMMDYRMDLEDASFDNDGEQIKNIGNQVNALLLTTAQAFNDTYQHQDWQNAKIIAQKLKFLSNLYRDINEHLTKSLTQNNHDNDDDLYV